MSSSRKAVFLDRDGTINCDLGYVGQISEFEYMPGAIEGLRLLSQVGLALVIVTNQSGIARGIFTENDYESLTKWMLQDLRSKGIEIDGVYHCPHHPLFSHPCSCRKPKLDLFRRAIEELNINPDTSWAIGDKERDLALCSVSECKGILLSAAQGSSKYHREESLLDAARYIASQEMLLRSTEDQEISFKESQ